LTLKGGVREDAARRMKVLVADDDLGILLALELLLRQEGIDVVCASTPEEAWAVACADAFDLFLLDLNYTKDTTSGAEGFSLLSRLHGEYARKPIVVMTAWASIDGAVEAMRRGASDYLPKPWDNAHLIELVRRFDPTRASAPDDFDSLAEKSPAMRQVLSTIDHVAFSDLPVLITGEHGTGKEMIARRIHAKSARPGAFVAVNAGAFPDGMLESELFGHVRGAFTDAKADRRGAFAEAESGTLFLDEVANMPLMQQAKLLRVLQDGQFRPLGAQAAVRSTARVVSATNVDVDEASRNGGFRADLLYRLNAIHIRLPPLRERREQIPALAARFVRTTALRHGLRTPELDAGVIDALSAHDWPGNVRELEHTMQRAVLLSASTGRITPELLSLPSTTSSSSARPPVPAGTIKDAERALITDALERHPGDRAAAARSVGLSRSAFYRRIQQLGIKLDR